jgi:type IV pilus assembly protein PilN
MIRINLIPYREKAKVANLARQIMIIAGTFVVFLIVIAAVQIYVSLSISNLETNVKDNEAELARLTKLIGDIEAVKKDKALLEKKLATINNLEENRLYPVRLLDAITILVPTKDMWLDKLTQTGAVLQIEGVARDNMIIARFMKNLESSEFTNSVELISSRQVEMSGEKLQQFSLSCVLRKGK